LRAFIKNIDRVTRYSITIQVIASIFNNRLIGFTDVNLPNHLSGNSQKLFQSPANIDEVLQIIDQEFDMLADFSLLQGIQFIELESEVVIVIEEIIQKI
jgi:hypothetical protein